MASVNDFLAAHPDLTTAEASGSSPSQFGEITLDAILLSADDQNLTFGHFGMRFSVSREDVTNVTDSSESTPNTFGKGTPVNITIKRDASLVHHQPLQAADLTMGVPFPIARPSLSCSVPVQSRSTSEMRWMSQNRIPRAFVAAASFGTTEDTQTQTFSASQSPRSSMSTANGGDIEPDFQNDDTLPDDSNVDGHITID
jgi:hypothetical protein